MQTTLNLEKRGYRWFDALMKFDVPRFVVHLSFVSETVWVVSPVLLCLFMLCCAF